MSEFRDISMEEAERIAARITGAPDEKSVMREALDEAASKSDEDEGALDAFPAREDPWQ